MDRIEIDTVAVPRQDAAASSEVVAEIEGSYLQLSDAEFRSRIRTAYRRMAVCDLCPRHCGAHRLSGDTGSCGAALRPKVFVWNLHRGEEPPVSGTRGSGTVFLSGCNLNCCYCQNYPLSQLHHGHRCRLDDSQLYWLNYRKREPTTSTLSHPLTSTPVTGAILPRGNRDCTFPSSTTRAATMRPSTLHFWMELWISTWAIFGYGRSSRHGALGSPRLRLFAKRALVEMHRQVGDISMDEQGRYVSRGLMSGTSFFHATPAWPGTSLASLLTGSHLRPT